MHARESPLEKSEISMEIAIENGIPTQIQLLELQQDPLIQYIQKYVLTGNVIPEKRRRKLFLNSMRVCLSLFGAISGIPFIGPAKSTVSDTTLGNIFAASTVVSFGVGSIWGWQGIINELSSASSEEQEMLQKLGCCSRTSSIAIAISLALFASIPTTYIAYLYNSNLTWPIINMISSAGFHAYGFDSFSKRILSRNSYVRDLSLFSRKLEHLMMEQIQAGITTKCLQSKNWLQQDPNSEQALAMLKMILIAGQEKRDFINTNHRYRVINSFQYLLSKIFPFAFSVITGYLSFNGVNEVWNNTFFKTTAMFLTIIPTLMIQLLGNTGVFKSLVNHIWGIDKINLENNPITHKYLIPFILQGAITCVAGILTAIVGGLVTNNTINNGLGNFGLPLIIFSTMGEVITRFFISSELSFDSMTAYIHFCGAESDKHLLQAEQNLKRLSNSIALRDVRKTEMLFLKFLDDKKIRELLNVSDEQFKLLNQQIKKDNINYRESQPLLSTKEDSLEMKSSVPSQNYQPGFLMKIKNKLPKFKPYSDQEQVAPVPQAQTEPQRCRCIIL